MAFLLQEGHELHGAITELKHAICIATTEESEHGIVLLIAWSSVQSTGYKLFHNKGGLPHVFESRVDIDLHLLDIFRKWDSTAAPVRVVLSKISTALNISVPGTRVWGIHKFPFELGRCSFDTIAGVEG